MPKTYHLNSSQMLTLLLFTLALGSVTTQFFVHFTPAKASASPLPTTQESAPIAKSKGHPVVHFEIGCKSLSKTSDFYSKLFDWQMKPTPMSANIKTGSEKGIEGHITSLGHEPEHYVAFYVEVEDIKAYLEKAKSLGGKVLVPAVKIPTGHFAWIADPDGNIVGLLQPKKP